VSSPASATSTGSVRLPLKPTDAQAAVFLRAASSRRFAVNWALARVKANQDSGPRRPPTTSPSRTGPGRSRSCDLVQRWDATRSVAAPRHGEQSVWTFRYAIPRRTHGALADS
jgi:putative transposase